MIIGEAVRRHPTRFRSAGGCSCRERLRCRSFPASHPLPAASHPRRRNGSGSGKRRPARAAPAAYRASSALCRHGRHQRRTPQCRTCGRRRTALTGSAAIRRRRQRGCLRRRAFSFSAMRKYLIVLGFWDAILPNGIFPGQGESPLRRRQGGNENRRSLRSNP